MRGRKMTKRQTKDGRTILTGAQYSALRERVWIRDRGKCVRCERRVSLTQHGFSDDMHLHHKNGRGMGGGKRDDTEEATQSLCAACHREEHNQ